MESNKKEIVEMIKEFDLDIEGIELDTEVNAFGVTATGCCRPDLVQ